MRIYRRIPSQLPDAFSAYSRMQYSRMQVGTTLPANGIEGDLFYKTDDRKLFTRRAGSWIEVDWQRLVQASPEWIAGRLRIQNGQLQISPNGNSWHDCIPAVGANSIELASVDNTNYSLLYWIAPGTTAIVRNANHLPIVYTPLVEPVYRLTWWNSVAYDYFIGLRPSNSAIGDGDGQFIAGDGSIARVYRSTNLSIFPIMEQSNTAENWGSAWIQVRSDQRFFGNGIGQGYLGHVLNITNTSATAPFASYWLGTWFRQHGTQFTMRRITITRLA